MGAVAPVHLWHPQDDQLLINAMEAGASLESLAKGAVCFSRCFTLQELSDRWRALLYDRPTSEMASSRIVEFELSTFGDPKSKSGSKERGSNFRKRRILSLRGQYYAMLKKVHSEPCQFDDFDACTLAENNNCNEHLELPHNEVIFQNHAIGSQIGIDYQRQDAAFGIGQGAFPDVLMVDIDASETFQLNHVGGSPQDHIDSHEDKTADGPFGSTGMYANAEDFPQMLVDEGVDQPCELRGECEGTCQIIEGNRRYSSSVHELNSTQAIELVKHHDAKAEPMFTFDLPSNSHESTCLAYGDQNMKSDPADGSDSITLHHLGFSSPSPDLPIWDTDEGASTVPIEGDFDEECKTMEPSGHDAISKNLITPRRDSIPTEPCLQGENCSTVRDAEEDFDGISLNFANDGSFFIDLDEKDLSEKGYLDGLNNFLMNSPTESHEDFTKNLKGSKATAMLGECNEISDNTCSVEPKDSPVQLIANHVADNDDAGRPPDLLDISLKASPSCESFKGFVFCPLNTEVFEIPCNDDIFPPEVSSPFSDLGLPLDGTVLRVSSKLPMDEEKSSFLNIFKKGQELNPHQTMSSVKFGQPANKEVIPMQHNDKVKANLLESDSVAGASNLPDNVLNPDIAMPVNAIVPSKEEAPGIGAREYAIYDGSVNAHLEKPLEGPYPGKVPMMDLCENSRLVNEVSKINPLCISSCKELISPEDGSEDRLQNMSRSEEEEEEQERDSDVGDEVPSYSDVEAMIFNMDLFPHDEESCFYAREVSKYQSMETRKNITRLELSAKACMQRNIAFRGAFAVFYGYRLKYYLKKPVVLIGRSTEEADVDIDLQEEGYANKISRRQAIIIMDEDGDFSLRNLGRYALIVDGKSLPMGQSCILTSGSIIEIRGMWFIFEVNPHSVRRYLSRRPRRDNEGRSLKLYSFKGELS